ncbi:NADH-quinone oxidoreductase subunit B family protein [Leptospira terpstrae]|uniref:NADH ubiquinone oxidoreductase, 20 Kd subunit n=1 Tax=Leptospira terpstrae serovar Hualin str. LT 11-33 = ATCC 700639 TaxID=1257025 RepID=N1VT40_9LEPT|nr:NADH ubiquinone oxidoreductase 20 Kd subunit [Leptospira terpstrae]EMY60142.1 NADH ubiquinone oxidoreductase, 20 Kd subunit [Leptospira terpstrae serovar Hualin str. LT 11-33 = ATCC 700639]
MNFLYELKSFFFPKNVLNFNTATPVHPTSRGIPIPTEKMREGSGSISKSAAVCPTKAIRIVSESEVQFDYGKCLQCGLCTEASDGNLRDSGFIYTFALSREELKVTYVSGQMKKVTGLPFPLTENQKRFQELTKKRGFLYREVAAAGNNTVESELNASFNSVFDSEREGVRCVASPKHADAVVFSGPVGERMAGPLETAWDVMSEPKALIACGTEAVSGGLYPMGKLPKEPDLYISGDPPRPDVILQGFRLLMGRFSFQFQEALHKILENEK